ncbi:hypothetical protein MMC17_005039 [Xylographa soralifera]|nr:hypothetical protein [Xylographa soralifera]
MVVQEDKRRPLQEIHEYNYTHTKNFKDELKQYRDPDFTNKFEHLHQTNHFDQESYSDGSPFHLKQKVSNSLAKVRLCHKPWEGNQISGNVLDDTGVLKAGHRYSLSALCRPHTVSDQNTVGHNLSSLKPQTPCNELAISVTIFNEQVRHDILQQKINHFARISLSYIADDLTATSTSKKPSKLSVEWLSQLCHPRNISESQNKNLVDTLETFQKEVYGCLAESHWKAQLRNTHVEFNSRDLAEDIDGFTQSPNPRSKAWIEDIYRQYFLRNGDRDKAKLLSKPMIRRVIQGRIKQCSFTLPPAFERHVHNRRQSSKTVDTTMWVHGASHHCGDLISDHWYYPSTGSKELPFDITELPGFRCTQGWRPAPSTITDVSLPIYMIIEDKPTREQEAEAKNHIMFLSAFILHERLLLRALCR